MDEVVVLPLLPREVESITLIEHITDVTRLIEDVNTSHKEAGVLVALSGSTLATEEIQKPRFECRSYE